MKRQGHLLNHVLVACGAGHNGLMNRRDRGVPGRGGCPEPGEEMEGVEAGVQQTAAPAWRELRTAAISPWMWKSGITCRQRPPTSAPGSQRCCRPRLTRVVWVSGTIFGREVVAGGCEAPRPSVGEGAAGTHRPAEEAPRSSKRPAAAPGGTTSSAIGIPSFPRHRDSGRRGCQPLLPAARRRSLQVKLEIVGPVTGIHGAVVARGDAHKGHAISGPFREHDGLRVVAAGPERIHAVTVAATCSTEPVCQVRPA